ncbi:MAG: alanine racemase [Oscillospiraceae bacterium]|jgi:diaminopimelate decarboxylase|nr:alanine racemase [Oscillospiraceae bacterium]
MLESAGGVEMNRQDGYYDSGADGGYNAKKHLIAAGCDAVELTATYGTPLVVLDELAIRQRCRAFTRGLKDAGLGGGAWYAAEVNPAQTVLRIVRQEGMGLAAATLAHARAGLGAGFPGEAILLYGPKSAEVIERAVQLGIGRVSIDSAEEIEQLQQSAKSAGVKQDVLLRINPGLNVPLHARDSLWGCVPGARFGVPHEEALGAVKRIAACPNLRLAGLHAHLGSQIESEQPYIAALEQLTDCVVLAMVVIGAEVRELNLGGGFPVRFARDDDPPPVSDTLGELAYALRSMCQRKGMGLPALSLTPGRAVVQEAGTLLTRVEAVKRFEASGMRTVAVTDAAAPDVSNTAFQRRQPMFALANRVSGELEPCAVADRSSSPSGFLAWDVTLPRLREGDLLACFAQGREPWPTSCATAVAQYGRASLINRRHEDDGFLSLEKVPARLNH